MYQGAFDTNAIGYFSQLITAGGSPAAPGFMHPEGLVVYFPSSKVRFKVLLENDEKHKGEVVAA